MLTTVSRPIRFALEWVQHIGLIIIALASIYAIGHEVWLMIIQQKVGLPDLLLLFIYLEILSMISMY